MTLSERVLRSAAIARMPRGAERWVTGLRISWRANVWVVVLVGVAEGGSTRWRLRPSGWAADAEVWRTPAELADDGATLWLSPSTMGVLRQLLADLRAGDETPTEELARARAEAAERRALLEAVVAEVARVEEAG